MHNIFCQKALLNDIEEAATLDPAFRDELSRLVAAARPNQINTQTSSYNKSTQVQDNNAMS